MEGSVLLPRVDKAFQEDWAASRKGMSARVAAGRAMTIIQKAHNILKFYSTRLFDKF